MNSQIWNPEYSPEKSKRYERKNKIGAGAFGESNKELFFISFICKFSF